MIAASFNIYYFCEMTTTSSSALQTLSAIRDAIQKAFKHCLCLWQLCVMKAVLRCDRDTIFNCEYRYRKTFDILDATTGHEGTSKSS